MKIANRPSPVAAAPSTRPQLRPIHTHPGIAPGGCIPPFPGRLPPALPGSTLNLHDRYTATRLDDVLSSPTAVMMRRLHPGKAQTLSVGKDGMVRGPEGQPLISVRLRDGSRAYVDPNTNQYYLANARQLKIGGRIAATGPYALPPGAQFSNSHFSDVDVRTLTRDVGPSFIFKPWPQPQPLPVSRFEDKAAK